jgi:putative DNA primase/helicase
LAGFAGETSGVPVTAWANYDDVISQMRAFGLDVDALEINTHRPVRCKEIGGDREKRGWYWLSDIELTKKDNTRDWYITGAFGIYRGAENLRAKVEMSKHRVAITAEQKAAMEARHKEMQQRRKAIRAGEIQRAAQKATFAWAKFVADGESDYLTRKRVKAHGLRFSPSGNGTVAVPMCDAAGRISGLQIIRANRQQRRALEKEYWPKGLEKIGRFHLVGNPVAGGVILLAEGYATAAELHEDSGFPVAVAFDAGNLVHVAKALAEAYSRCRILVCADDDYLQKCKLCHQPTLVAVSDCSHCGLPHGQVNPGIEAARAAAFAVSGHTLVPSWPFDRAGKKLTDFNDLGTHAEGGKHLVRAQVWEALRHAGWDGPQTSTPAAGGAPGGAGAGDRCAVSVMPLGDAVERFLPIDDGTGEVLFDQWEQKLVKQKQMVAVLQAGVRWDDVKRHPHWIQRGSYFLRQVGFDPDGSDPKVKLNTWTGWPTTPKAGNCKRALDLLRYLCSDEPNADEIHSWILKWLAYPIQHPGAKMKSALVVHGPQGTGKSMIFEAIGELYGEYFVLLNQGAIEDKFNSDWAGRKLYIVADEIVARQDMHHIKNQLKTLVTGQYVRINSKFLQGYQERNHINLVFISNERQPVVIEHDDRRHGVIWTPPALPKSYYTEVAEELENGGLAALHQYLLDVDLTGFGPHTQPPMTRSKADLQDLGRGSVERFVHEWQRLEVVDQDGEPLPLCPCLGSHLYAVYRKWCDRVGERDLGDKRLIGHVKKMHGWTAGQSEPTWRSFSERITTNRKLVVPSKEAMTEAINNCSTDRQEKLHPDQFATKKDWLTHCFFRFRDAAGFSS